MMLIIYGVWTATVGTLGMFFGIFSLFFAPFLQMREESREAKKRSERMMASFAKRREELTQKSKRP